jgi:site-specific recombinase XerD
MRSAGQKNTDMLLRYVQNFFQDYLVTQRGLSANTVLAYRDTLKLCLASISRIRGKSAADLSLDDLTGKAILAFLEDIETGRENSPRTRNQRLAALRTFFRYLVAQDPSRAAQYQTVIMIPLKRAPRRMMEYLEIAEIEAVLKSIDRSSELGKRDYLLLNLLYNTGARVQEDR